MLFMIVVVVVGAVAAGALVVAARRVPDYQRECLTGAGVVVAAVVLLVVLFRPAGRSDPGVCNVGMDASGSAQEDAIVDGYMRTLPEFLADHCLDARGGEIGVITAHSINESGPPVALDFAAEPGRNERKAREAAEAAITDSVVPDARALLAASSRRGTGTDIIGYLDRIDQTYEDAPEDGRFLLLFTDGGQTGTPNLYRDPLGPEDIDRYLAELEDTNRLPRLTGVRVWVVGANLGRVATTVPGDRTAQIEAFWRAFFAAAGADVEAYAPTL